VWRLHTDPAILTPGRFYFAPTGTPACPVGHLRGSRNYVADQGLSRLEWGELDGKQKYDRGDPPIFVPGARLVGGEPCLADGIDNQSAAERASDFYRTVCIGGRDYRFPTLIYTSFSVAYGESDFTYYNDVALTLTDAMCEARYEGATDIPNTKAIVRVTDVPDGSLATNFYLCDSGGPPPPPIITDCCPDGTPASWIRTYRFYGSSTYSPFNEVWSLICENITQTYAENCAYPIVATDFPGWFAYLDCDGQNVSPESSVFCIRTRCFQPGGYQWRNEVFTADGTYKGYFDTDTGQWECNPLRVNIPFTGPAVFNMGFNFCGKPTDAFTGPWPYGEVESPEE